ncbi:nuclear transport factor 2 family protein [Rhodococcus sp. D2-41]|uniref:Nuclear transport factor 2 family protein n=1 Tax=Speluncibacter jeojiensis TaxID=2710754 RepID=A0A9X4REA4_9ACTN|nr:nuclear transport factor 2 family protein [Rhodococcus sp. D2-41]MDG3011653.1 nuclear transport factor 2 family protein [Rhodococcus sp. D2-41]MDG3014992.1 nuclear transport factor 2 family protein [Corynebacteriales bacterium D3-21]
MTQPSHAQPSHVEITNLVHRYAELVDSGDWDGLVELFAHGELHGSTGVLRGDAVRTNFEAVRLYPDGTPRTRHVTTNLIVEVHEDDATATARSHVTVFQFTPQSQSPGAISPGAFPVGAAIAPIFLVRYHDRFHRVDGRWRFASRRFVDPVAGDISGHLG